MARVEPVEPDPRDLTPEQNFFRQCEACGELFAEKNRAYDNNFVHDGLLGTAVEISGAASRLRVLVVKSIDHGRSTPEAIRDALMDIHNYATMSLMCLEQNNWEGE